MKKVVVGFDGQEPARLAVQEAAVLANATGAELHVVRVLDDGAPSGEADAARRESEEILRHEILDGVTAQHLVLFGSAADSLVDYAQTVDANLIVVGNRRVQGLDRVLGSVAVNVLRQCDCSVYVAHTV